MYSLLATALAILISAVFPFFFLRMWTKPSRPIVPHPLIPQSCKHCQRLVIDLAPSKLARAKFEQELRTRTSVFRAKIEEDGEVLFSFTRLEVVCAAANGCGLCQWILEDLGGDDRHVTDDSLLYAKIYHFKKGFDINRVEYFGFCRKDLTRSVAKGRHGFAVYATKDNMVAPYVSTRPINPETASDQSFALARRFLRDCAASHIECLRPRVLFMPTRVIEVDFDSGIWNLCLRQTNKFRVEPYIALSYCWGGDQKSKTTRDTFDRAQIHISYEKLSKSVQDAIITTQKLGIRFLWVDSICIIQDDPEDMALEIAQMPLIYSQAIVTVAASVSSTAKDGFLLNRAVTQLPKLVFELPFRCPGGNLGSVILFVPTRDEEVEPLDRRAWALQERLLASRILEFGTHQLRWACAGVKIDEEFVDGWTIADDRQGGSKAFLDHECFGSAFKERNDWLIEARSLDYGRVIHHWHRLRTAYSNRSLTQSGDRIVAISGIAKRYNELFQSPYFAGLWGFAMPFELLWNLDSRAIRARRPKYQGPSWSWVSINGGVEQHVDEFAYKKSILRLEFINCDIQLFNSGSPYGAVISGRLKVKGKLRLARWLRKIDSSVYSRSDLLAEGDGINKLAARMRPDAIEDEFANSNIDFLPVFLLEVVYYDDPYPGGPSGLVLRHINESCFMRLGLFEFKRSYLPMGKSGESSENKEMRYRTQMNWFQECESETIVIV